MEKNSGKLKVAWLFPDILYLHGERGNILALERVARLAGLEPVIEKIDFDKGDFRPMDYDVIFCPPGEIASFGRIIEWLKPYSEELQGFMEAGRVLLVTGTSQCIFGKETVREDGSVIEGLGLIDCDYSERTRVYGDDICFDTGYCCASHAGMDQSASGEGSDKDSNVKRCFGVQIQMMDVDSREKPFGQLIYGFGNTGKDKTEGAWKFNSIFTNVLGPMLVLNPWITKALMEKAVRARGDSPESFDLDTSLEEKSLESKLQFALTKKTNLTNCK